MTPPNLTRLAQLCIDQAYSKELNHTTTEAVEAVERVLRRVWLDGFDSGRGNGIRKVEPNCYITPNAYED